MNIPSLWCPLLVLLVLSPMPALAQTTTPDTVVPTYDTLSICDLEPGTNPLVALCRLNTAAAEFPLVCPSGEAPAPITVTDSCWTWGCGGDERPNPDYRFSTTSGASSPEEPTPLPVLSGTIASVGATLSSTPGGQRQGQMAALGGEFTALGCTQGAQGFDYMRMHCPGWEVLIKNDYSLEQVSWTAFLSEETDCHPAD